VKKYVPHLAELQATCAKNYALLMSLLPDIDTSELSYTFSASKTLQYRITLLDTAPYTTTLKMEQINGAAILPTPVMDVRLYHDAKMAEVLSSQYAGAIAPSYDYPNPDMHQKDEKERVNAFLSEWLNFCLKHRQTVSTNA
jgi:uncharacterized protein YqiB (DUF1249 family)